VDEAVAQGKDAPVGVHGDLDVMDLPALLVGGEQVLVTVLDPLHGTFQVQGGERDQDLFGIEQHDLRPEASPGVGRDHLHAELGETEHPGGVLDVRALGGVRECRRLVLRHHPRPSIGLRSSAR
jgi:hypothetical protein